LSRLELDAWTRIPRKNTPIVVYGEHEGTDLAPDAVAALVELNVPSKAFGELVASRCQTPSLAAEEVAVLLDAGADVVVLDARRFDEYTTMSIPAAVSVPGGELVLRIGELAPNPQTPVIVNCAGRTRSIIGTQSLINAGVPNPVTSLRNGIPW
jgi:rhodanese-related sulfurtransferase